jgi:peptide/nickel transport system ATP-binding protein
MGLAGESGCGKSTLGNALIYLDRRMRLAGGQALLDGGELPIADSVAMRRRRMTEVSLVPQYAMSALPQTRRIAKITRDLLRSHDIKDHADVIAEMRHRIQLIGLPDEVLRSYAFELSGGMRQRVTIVMSTLLNPSLLIADEVTSALDVSTQRAVGEMLMDFRDRGFVKSVIMITHDLSILAQVADSIAVMYAGRLAEKASTTTITEAPLHPYTQALIASLPAVGVRHDKVTLTGIPGRPPSLASPPPGCRFRDRCPFAFGECAQTPPFGEVQPGHLVACWKVSQEAGLDGTVADGTVAEGASK